MIEHGWEYLLSRKWRVYHSALPLITCDEPVVPVCGPWGDRTIHSGVGTAATILFPLDPHHVLSMFNPHLTLSRDALTQELSSVEADSINVEVACHSERLLIEQSSRSRTLTIQVPPLPFDRVAATAFQPHPSDGDVGFRLAIPSRLSMLPAPPSLPVARWWTAAVATAQTEVPIDPDSLESAFYNYWDLPEQ
jgi:hypothetical protein